MGFFSDLLDPSTLMDPLGLSGSAAADQITGTAQTNSDLLRGFSDVSQENLQPFLDVSNQQLPALEAGASPEGFFNDANALRPLASSITQPIVEEQIGNLSSSLGSKGLTRSGFAATSAAGIQEDADLSMLLQLQQMLQGRRSTVAGQGAQAGGNLARIGQQSAEQIGQIQSQGVLGGQQALAAGQQNMIGLAGLATDFFAPKTQRTNEQR
jgi:hypothetical protein